MIFLEEKEKKKKAKDNLMNIGADAFGGAMGALGGALGGLGLGIGTKK